MHQGERSTFSPRNLEIIDGEDGAGAPIRCVEGWDASQRVHVEHPLRTDAYSVRATDETTGEILWGPVTMPFSGA